MLNILQKIESIINTIIFIGFIIFIIIILVVIFLPNTSEPSPEKDPSIATEIQPETK